MKKVNPKLIAIVIGVIIICGIAFIVGNYAKSDNPKSVHSDKTVSTVPTASPTEVVKDFKKYSGKTIAVKGRIVQVEKDYYVVSEEQKPSALKLDFSKSGLNPSDYADIPGKPDQNKKYVQPSAVTVTGTLDLSQQGKPALLIVKSVK